ncbi:MAG TPA: energy transducer TonB [Candidatus Dormibacteraeota bacterium]|nr:energy transducer TonB [Candidatus Dormibacteraeota bacterium]
MRLPQTAALFTATLLAILLQTPCARAGDDVEEQLRAGYLDKVLTLRHFFKGDHLSFQPDGSLIGVGEIGPWTLDGQVLVKGMEVSPHTLRIQGRRVCLIFDAKGKPYRDILALLDELKTENRDKMESDFLDNSVEIEIALVSGKPDLREASSAIDAVFLKPGESLADILPDYWRDYFDQIEGQPRIVRHTTEKVYYVGPGSGISAPRVTFTPEPEFSVEARKAKYQGKVVVSLVVNSSGSVGDLAITSPVGMGLDEKAVAAVRSWKFEPATKDGKPVPVHIAVEVDFHLY